MHIQWISVENLPPLKHIDIYDFDKQVNLFIGSNASGKSTLLRAIEWLSSSWGTGTDNEFNDDSSYPIYIKTSSTGARVYIGVNYGCLTDTAYYPHGADSTGSGISIWEAAPFLYIPSIRLNLPSMDIFDQTIKGTTGADINEPLLKLFDTESGIFSGQYIEPSINSLRQSMTPDWYDWYVFREPVNLGLQIQLRRALELGYSCSKSICSEVIYDDVLHPYVEVQDDGINLPERVVHHNLGIGTRDDILGEPLYAGALSSGTQGTLLWIWALALKMAHHYDWQEGWEKKPAILLIDEIENHLHPTWQRRVIPALLEHFPGLQIFATTHSPFVVAGLKAGQVHLLNRDENGVVTARPNTEDIIGWTADEILRTMMGVNDPTDDATAAAARELRELRSEGPRDTVEAEEKRQQRMIELRQKVDRDLLAGGPWKRQREIFEERFAESLRKYRESQDLNQEGT